MLFRVIVAIYKASNLAECLDAMEEIGGVGLFVLLCLGKLSVGAGALRANVDLDSFKVLRLHKRQESSPYLSKETPQIST